MSVAARGAAASKGRDRAATRAFVGVRDEPPHTPRAAPTAPRHGTSAILLRVRTIGLRVRARRLPGSRATLAVVMKRDGRTWNDGNLELSPIEMQRRRAAHEAQVDGPMDRIFVRIEAALAPNEAITRWFVTHSDPEEHHVGAVLLHPGFAIGKLEIGLTPRSGGTWVTLGFTYTAMSEQGNALFDEQIEGRIRHMLCSFIAALRGSSLEAEELDLPCGSPSPRAAREGFRAVTAKVVEHRVLIDDAADACFARACPLSELDWIDDWHFDLLYSDSGRNEDDCMFLEAMSGLAVHRSPRANTCWYTTLHDVARRRFHAVLLTDDFIIGRWAVEMSAVGNGSTEVRWSIAYVGLNERGNQIVLEQGLETRALGMLRFIASSLKLHCETGRVLRLPAKRKVKIALSLVVAALGRHVRRVTSKEATSP